MPLDITTIIEDACKFFGLSHWINGLPRNPGMEVCVSVGLGGDDNLPADFFRVLCGSSFLSTHRVFARCVCEILIVIFLLIRLLFLWMVEVDELHLLGER